MSLFFLVDDDSGKDDDIAVLLLYYGLIWNVLVTLQIMLNMLLELIIVL